jgi:hypothetical protein
MEESGGFLHILERQVELGPMLVVADVPHELLDRGTAPVQRLGLDAKPGRPIPRMRTELEEVSSALTMPTRCPSGSVNSP